MNNMNEYLECKLCPHECKINRNEKIGRCKSSSKTKVALYKLHYFEEPCISGKNGSGTVFFLGCNLNCKYCQNYKISQNIVENNVVDVNKLANIFIELQEMKANNINLVTGVIYVPETIEAIKIARKKGLKIPIIYNSSGYEKVETLKMLEGYIDVYLPDFKYYYEELGYNLSNINKYPVYAKEAIKEMYKQVGNPIFDENGIIKKGLIIRHLILPNHVRNSKMVLKWIKENLGRKTYVSIMAQYFPTYKAMETNDINRKITKEELEEIKNYINELNLENGYIQDIEENEERYVPEF